MNRNFLIRSNLIPFCCLFFILSPLCQAFAVTTTGYISDRLIVSLRNSPDDLGENVGRVQTGDKVEILETKDNYHLIRTENNKDGWILKQYILFSKPKEAVIEELQSKNGELQNQLSSARDTCKNKIDEIRQTIEVSSDQSIFIEKVEKLKQVTSQRDDLLQQNKKLESLLQSVKSENYQLVKKAGLTSELKKKIKGLEEEIALLRKRLITVDQEKTSPFVNIDPHLYWFLGGAVVLLTGFLIGRISNNKKKSKLSF